MRICKDEWLPEAPLEDGIGADACVYDVYKIVGVGGADERWSEGGWVFGIALDDGQVLREGFCVDAVFGDKKRADLGRGTGD